MQNIRPPIKVPARLQETIKRGESELATDLGHAELIRNWLEFEKQNGVSDNTINAYQIGINIFTDYLEDNALETGTVSPKDVLGFKSKLSESYSPQTINLRLSAVRSFYRFMVINGYLPFSPAQIVKGAKRSKSTHHKRDQLTNAEVHALFETCQDNELGIRDRAILTLMLYCALRRVELHRANLEDLTTKQGRLVLWVQGKGRLEKDEFVVIPANQEQVINTWLNVRPGDKSEALFTSLSIKSKGERLALRSLTETIKDKMIEAGIMLDPMLKPKKDKYKHSRKSVHSLRHTAITNALQNGATPLQVQQMARHSSFDTTLNYHHSSDRLLTPAELLINYD